MIINLHEFFLGFQHNLLTTWLTPDFLPSCCLVPIR